MKGLIANSNFQRLNLITSELQESVQQQLDAAK